MNALAELKAPRNTPSYSPDLVLPKREPFLSGVTLRREITVGELTLGTGTHSESVTIKNLDAQGISTQILAEKALSTDKSTFCPPGLAYLYVGRNRFEAVPRATAEALQDERLRDSLKNTKNLGRTPRLSQNSVVFFGPGNPAFADRLCAQLGTAKGNLILDRFPNSETRIEILESVRDRQAFVVAHMSGSVNESLMETTLLVQALKLADARRITVILPYFGYSRQDRKADTRPPISAKVVTDILKAQGAHQILTVDLHATQVEGFFDGPFENLFGLSQIVAPLIKDEGDQLVVVSPDAGGSKRAEKFAREVERCSGSFTPLVVMSKFRSGPSVPPTVTLTAGEELLKGKTCVLVDDMIDTGGSMIAAARALKARGAGRVILCASHGIFSENAIDRLQRAEFEDKGRSVPLVDRIYVTDTLPLHRARNDSLRVVSIAPLVAEAIVRLDQPLGSLRELRNRNDLGELL